MQTKHNKSYRKRGQFKNKCKTAQGSGRPNFSTANQKCQGSSATINDIVKDVITTMFRSQER